MYSDYDYLYKNLKLQSYEDSTEIPIIGSTIAAIIFASIHIKLYRACCKTYIKKGIRLTLYMFSCFQEILF